MIAPEHNYVASASHLFTTSSLHPMYNDLGRPRLNLAVDEITQLFDMYRSFEEVASYLSISVRTFE